MKFKITLVWTRWNCWSDQEQSFQEHLILLLAYSYIKPLEVYWQNFANDRDNHQRSSMIDWQLGFLCFVFSGILFDNLYLRWAILIHGYLT